MIVEGFQIAWVIVAGVGWDVIGVAVPALFERDQAPCGSECFDERREGYSSMV
jgi:hypothetical protein